MRQDIGSGGALTSRSAQYGPGKALGIWSFVLAFFVPVLGLIFGIIARAQSRRAGVANPLALAGIIISVVAIVAGAVLWIVFAAGN